MIENRSELCSSSLARGRRAWALAGMLLVLVGGSGCAGKKSKDELFGLNARARYERGLAQLAKGKTQAATKTLSMVDQYEPEERLELEPLVRLAIADATYYQGTDLGLIESRGLYLDFVTLFSDHPLAGYAQFQAAMCSLRQVNHPSKDQTDTHLAIRDFAEVARRFPGSSFAEPARVMRLQAEANLAEHEFLVGRFYMRRDQNAAAAERFRSILERYPDFIEREKVYYYYGQLLLEADNTTEGAIYLGKLLSDFPRGDYAEQARKALDKMHEVSSLRVEGLP